MADNNDLDVFLDCGDLLIVAAGDDDVRGRRVAERRDGEWDLEVDPITPSETVKALLLEQHGIDIDAEE